MTYSTAKNLADLLQYYQKMFITDTDGTVVIYPSKWDEISFQLKICNTDNSNSHKKIIQTSELLKIINEFKKSSWDLLKLNDHEYLYDNTTEKSVPPLIETLSIPLTITLSKNYLKRGYED